MLKPMTFKPYHVSLGNIETVYNVCLIKVYRINKGKKGKMEGRKRERQERIKELKTFQIGKQSTLETNPQ